MNWDAMHGPSGTIFFGSKEGCLPNFRLTPLYFCISTVPTFYIYLRSQPFYKKKETKYMLSLMLEVRLERLESLSLT